MSGGTDTEAAARETVDAYFRGVNAENWDAVAALFTPDGHLRAVGAAPCHGRAEIAAYFPRVLAALPAHHDDPTRVVVGTHDGHPTVLVEIAFRGRTAAGAPVEFVAVDVVDLTADGRAVTALSSWYDTAAVTRAVRGS